MSISNEENSAPKRTQGDYAHSLVKVALSAVPLVGGSAAELFAMMIAPPLERRRDEWLTDLAEVVQTLKARNANITPEELSKNEAFISATLQASQIAMRTHQSEKRECLKNALIHIATEKSRQDDAETFFLTLIDLFTVTHVEILRLFKDRSTFPQERFRVLESNRSLTDSIVLDLNARGLLNDPRPFAARTREPLHSFLVDSWTLSDLGSRFLNFISA